jgi:hypothetical protein
MTTEALLGHCRAVGIRLTVDSGRLRYAGPADALDAATIAALGEHKAALVTLLTGPKPDPYARLHGPYRTPWRTWVWSDPDAPPLEAFGPPPDEKGGGR